MSRTNTEVMLAVHKKLRGESGNEFVSAATSLISLLTLIFAVPATDGWVRAGIIFMLVSYIIAVCVRFAGWKIVTLLPDEQEWLKENFPKRERL